MHMRQVVVSMVGILVLAGCGAGTTGSQDEGQTTDELAAHDGEVCPDELPQAASNADHGLGTSARADSSPALAPPDAAWVCRFDPVDAGPGPDGDGTTLGWKRKGEPRPVESSGLEALGRHLDNLEPAESGQDCPDDLGPRWMLVHAYENDLTGVVIDDYGCQGVRLTDEPFETPPGEATQPGTVSGVLTAPDGLLDEIQSIK